MKRFSALICSLLSLLAQAQVTAVYKPGDNPNKDIAVLENEYIRAEFSSVGGRLISFKDKRINIDLTYKDGALRDQLVPNGVQPFPDSVYRITISENTPRRASIVFAAPAVNEREFIRISRTVVLESNSTALKVSVTITNQHLSTLWQESTVTTRLSTL